MKENGEYVRSLSASAFLWGDDREWPPDDDPAEVYHEASKFTPALHLHQVGIGAGLLERNDQAAKATVARSVKRHLHLPSIALPKPEYPGAALGDVICRRRSRREFGGGAISLDCISTLLHAAYGVTHDPGHENEQRLRTVPSGGGLYPLDVYLAVREVDRLAAGLYHYDPLRKVLEVIREGDLTSQLGDALVETSSAPSAERSVIFLMAGVFWRTRFKYGLRGYRFVLLEAGHVAQNLLLVAEALGVSAYPIGGFYDRRLDAVVGLDGVNESVVYGVALGPRATEARAE